MRSNRELTNSYRKRGGNPALHVDSTSKGFNGGFASSSPPEMEILIGKDPDNALHDYGYPNSRISELGFRRPPVRRRGSPRVSASSRKPKRTLPTGLERLSYEEVEGILDDDGYTKRQIAELGFRRFGIPEKSLLHSRKYDAVTSVRDAVANERILDAIARQARKAGAARTA